MESIILCGLWGIIGYFLAEIKNILKVGSRR